VRVHFFFGWGVLPTLYLQAILHFGLGLGGFALGQLCYSLSYSLSFFLLGLGGLWGTERLLPDRSVSASFAQLVPQRLEASGGGGNGGGDFSLSLWLSPELASLLGSFTIQTVQKFFLQEGEKLALMTLIGNLNGEQGVYGLVSNLGSLVARFFFQPIEEASFAEFSELLKPSSSSSASTHTASPTLPRKRSVTPAPLLSAWKVLTSMLKLMLMIGLLFLTFGPPYSYSLITLLYGAKWSETAAASVLAHYCAYVSVMALNGVSEAFLFAVVQPQELQAYTHAMLPTSLLYLLSCAALSPYGAKGLVWSNCLSMLCRMLWARRFALRSLKALAGSPTPASPSFSSSSSPPPYSHEPEFNLAPALPSSRLLLSSALAAALAQASEALLGVQVHCRQSSGGLRTRGCLSALGVHIGLGVFTFVGWSWLLLREERPFLKRLRSLLSNEH